MARWPPFPFDRQVSCLIIRQMDSTPFPPPHLHVALPSVGPCSVLAVRLFCTRCVSLFSSTFSQVCVIAPLPSFCPFPLVFCSPYKLGVLLFVLFAARFSLQFTRPPGHSRTLSDTLPVCVVGVHYFPPYTWIALPFTILSILDSSGVANSQAPPAPFPACASFRFYYFSPPRRLIWSGYLPILCEYVFAVFFFFFIFPKESWPSSIVLFFFIVCGPVPFFFGFLVPPSPPLPSLKCPCRFKARPFVFCLPVNCFFFFFFS